MRFSSKRYRTFIRQSKCVFCTHFAVENAPRFISFIRISNMIPSYVVCVMIFLSIHGNSIEFFNTLCHHSTSKHTMATNIFSIANSHVIHIDIQWKNIANEKKNILTRLRTKHHCIQCCILYASIYLCMVYHNRHKRIGKPTKKICEILDKIQKSFSVWSYTKSNLQFSPETISIHQSSVYTHYYIKPARDNNKATKESEKTHNFLLKKSYKSCSSWCC